MLFHVIVGLVLLIAAQSLTPDANAGFSIARQRVATDCRALLAERPDSSVCRIDAFSRSAVPDVKTSQQLVETAKRAIAKNDLASAEASLTTAMDLARVNARRGRRVPTAVATRITRNVVSVLESGELPNDVVARVIEHAPRRFLDDALDGYRTDRAFHLARTRETHAWRSTVIGTRLLTEEMNEVDESLSRMSAAIRAGDRTTCERLGAMHSAIHRWGENRSLEVDDDHYDAAFCREMMDVRSVDLRLHALERKLEGTRTTI